MSPTLRLSRSISRIGRHSFDRRMKIASPLFVDKEGDVEKLLNEVDRLSNQLHDAFPYITESDYCTFGPELKIVIDTLKSLRKESSSRKELKKYNSRMREQIADLEELAHDFSSFKVNAPKNEALKATISSLSKLNLSKYTE